MTTEYWTDPAGARAWAQRDAQRELLALPRRIAAELIAIDNPEPQTIADIGSGPGAFLAVMLERFSGVRGLWRDISQTMRQLADENLKPYIERVEFLQADMTDLSELPGNLDAIITSRAIHHLDHDGLVKFYCDAATHLAVKGWLINLDHFAPPGDWNARLREVRKRLIPATGRQAKHEQPHPLASLPDHLAGLSQAGFSDIDVPWRSFGTALFAARKAPES